MVGDLHRARRRRPAGPRAPPPPRRDARLSLSGTLHAASDPGERRSGTCSDPGAFGAGLVSFVSPCVLPLVPGYLSAVTGVSRRRARGRRAGAGCSAPSLRLRRQLLGVFILLGLTATGLGADAQRPPGHAREDRRRLIIAMGVLFVASLFVARLNREWRVDALMTRAGKGGPLVAGMAFAIAWTPCIGPTLGRDPERGRARGSAAHGGAPARRLLGGPRRSPSWSRRSPSRA